jgi:limonene-1,2-epoxide hydrolase
MNAGELVQRFLDAFFAQDAQTAVASVTEDFRFINVPFPHRPLVGHESLRRRLLHENLGFPGKLDDYEIVMLRTLAVGDQVMNERIDRFKYRGQWMEIPVAAVWELKGGLIAVWKDYYDLGLYVRCMASVGQVIDVSLYYS